MGFLFAGYLKKSSESLSIITYIVFTESNPPNVRYAVVNGNCRNIVCLIINVTNAELSRIALSTNDYKEFVFRTHLVVLTISYLFRPDRKTAKWF